MLTNVWVSVMWSSRCWTRTTCLTLDQSLILTPMYLTVISVGKMGGVLYTPSSTEGKVEYESKNKYETKVCGLGNKKDWCTVVPWKKNVY